MVRTQITRGDSVSMKGICELDEAVNAENKNNLMLVDCLNFSFRYKHRGQTDFAADYLRTIGSFARSYGAKEVILLTDYKKSVYREHVDPEYKANRKALKEAQTEEEAAKFLDFLKGFEAAMELAQTMYPLLKFKYVEADDLAAYLVKKLAHKFKHTWLISSDGDWDLLLAENVSRFSFVTRREYTLDNFFDNHHCDNPEQFVSMKVLEGDKGDNIIGIESVGPKRAYNLVREHGSAMDIYENMPLAGKQKFIQNINASEDRILTNYELVDLVSFSEEAIAFANPENLNILDEFIGKYL